MLKTWLAAGLILGATLAQAAGQLPLWEAAKGQDKLYLFGSIHLCKASCFPLPAAAIEHLKTSQALVVELDPQKPELQLKLMAAARLPEGQSLADHLSAREWKALKKTSAQLGLPEEALARLRPWMAGTVLTLLAAQRAGFEAAQGIDLAFMQQAKSLGLPLEELETADEQISALGAGSDWEQGEMLRTNLALLRQNKLPAYLDQLIEAWRVGDEKRLQALSREGLPADSEITQALIERRNLTMADRLNRTAQDGRARFVVVGVAHLLGQTGIPALLTKRGWHVRQLRTEE